MSQPTQKLLFSGNTVKTIPIRTIHKSFDICVFHKNYGKNPRLVFTMKYKKKNEYTTVFERKLTNYTPNFLLDRIVGNFLIELSTRQLRPKIIEKIRDICVNRNLSA